MAFPTPVNDQATDTVSQNNISVLGEAPAIALASLFQLSAQAVGMMLQNGAAAQQQLAITAQAATARSVATLTAGRVRGLAVNG